MTSETNQLNSYSEVSVLGEDRLRLLLTEDDEAIQVWASWALGIRLNNIVCPPEVQRLMTEEPSPGVRQNLLIFLAGSGNHDLLEKYAKKDPSSNVRAAACRLISRTSEDIHSRSSLLDEILKSEKSSEVLSAILVSAVLDGRPVGLEPLRYIVDGGDEYLQGKVLDVISSFADEYYSTIDVKSELLSWVNQIHNDIYKKYCSLCNRICGDEAVLNLVIARNELAYVPLKLLFANGFRTGWKKLDILERDGNGSYVPLLLDLLDKDESQGAIVWLLSILRKYMPNANEYDPDWSDIRHAALPRVYSILHTPVQPRQTEHALPILQMLLDELSSLQEPDLDDTSEYIDIASNIEYYENFINKLEHWCRENQ